MVRSWRTRRASSRLPECQSPYEHCAPRRRMGWFRAQSLSHDRQLHVNVRTASPAVGYSCPVSTFVTVVIVHGIPLAGASRSCSAPLFAEFYPPRTHPVPRAVTHCMDGPPHPSAPFASARARSHQGARRLLRAVPGACGVRLRRLPRDRALGSRAPGRLVGDAQGTGAADALLAMRQEDCRGCGGGEGETARCAEESAVERPIRPPTPVSSQTVGCERMLSVVGFHTDT